MRRFPIAVSLLLLVLNGASAATWTASSVEFADVASAVSQSTSGDMVQIPGGTAVWNETLVITNALTISGAGSNATVILCTNTAFLYRPVTSNLFRLTALAISNNVESTVGDGIVGIVGMNAPNGGLAKALFRVDHCLFMRGSRVIWPRGYNEGVIDHCTFWNANIAIAPQGDEANSWARPIIPGTTNCVVIEDNLFSKDDNAVGTSSDQSIYHQGGARTVIRYNVFDGSMRTNYDTVWFDSHGNQSSGFDNSDTNTWVSIRGQPLIELYGNSFISHHTYRFADFRGGSVLCYSNVWTDLTSSAPNPIRLWEEEAWQTQFFDPVRSATNHGYPAFDQISNCFFWSNVVNGTLATSASLSHTTEEEFFVREDRDYWLVAPNTTNGAPAGIYAEYAPLAHPHPLVTAQDSRRTYINKLIIR